MCLARLLEIVSQVSPEVLMSKLDTKIRFFYDNVKYLQPFFINIDTSVLGCLSRLYMHSYQIRIFAYQNVSVTHRRDYEENF